MARALKIVVSVSLLAYLLHSVSWAEMETSLAGARVGPLALAFLILLVQFPVGAWKWSIALSIHDLDWRVLSLLRIGMIAFFLNNFLPTSIGGDVYRAYRTLPADGSMSSSISAILLQRIVGLLALLLVGGIGAFALYLRGHEHLTGELAITFVLPPLMAILLLLVLNAAKLRPLLRRLARLPKLAPLARNAKLILGRKGRLAYLVFASLVFQLFAVTAIVMLFAAVGETGIVAEIAVVIAASSLASLLPISINSIGLMEGSFALTAQQLGVHYESAVLVALFLRLFMVAASAACALVFLWDRGREHGPVLAQDKVGSA